MPFGIGRFLGRNAGTIGTIAGTVLGGGPMGGAIGGLVGSAFQKTMPQQGGGSSNTYSPEQYDPTQGLGLGQMVQRQQGRNLEAEVLSQIAPTALGPAAYLQSAAIMGTKAAAGRVAQERMEREQQRLASQAIQGRVGVEQQQQQTIQNLLGMQMQGRQFGIQTAQQQQQFDQQMAMAEREQRAANLDALLSLGSTLLTSPTEGTALGNIMSKGNTRLKRFGGRLGGLFSRGQGGGSNTTTTTGSNTFGGFVVQPQDPYGQYQNNPAL